MHAQQACFSAWVGTCLDSITRLSACGADVKLILAMPSLDSAPQGPCVQKSATLSIWYGTWCFDWLVVKWLVGDGGTTGLLLLPGAEAWCVLLQIRQRTRLCR